MTNKTSGCEGCGKCCIQGGPPLHIADLDLLESSVLGWDNLITIRKGELALQPGQTEPTLVKAEFVKIKGQGASWACLFYNDKTKKCTIHENKPYSCRTFFCQQPDRLLAISGKKLLDRFALLGENKDYFSLIREHEGRFPCPNLADVLRSLGSQTERQQALEQLSALVNDELVFRQNVCKQNNISLARELFYFGRPLFQLLIPLGVEVREENGTLFLR